ncbi:hypothetical protein SY83_07235 [Paenibacillus swuensis]|uniref:Superoxide dismutase copper/zinc binding domain-containing protein n=1 Tax=Paenibacillus swuensis TaxID=1178515 RepID=A0A172TGP2_9BACL|nr:superoxide dismutase family protein [Paenibacillus swuensis]ANE46106.1 hypothetical protein SY83_07235 [Paenibacillus swuensis]
MSRTQATALSVVCVVSIILLSACGLKSASVSSEIPAASPVEVKLIDTTGKPAGTAMLKQQANGVLVHIQATGLTKGKHGFHFHEAGKCEAPTFKSAGEHFNPTQKEHGFNNPKGFHGGDLPNLVADAKGQATAEIFVDYVTLAEGKPNSLLKEGGTSIIIHTGEDDYVTNPAGNSGDRALCGVISK